MRNFSFEKPTRIDEALALLGDNQNWDVLAGGTTLVDLLKHDVMQPSGLVDITGIKELESLDTSGDTFRFGALARMSDVADDDTVKSEAPALSEALWKAASPQLRQVARLGGNVLQRTRCPYFRDTSYACNKRRPGSGCAALDGGKTTLHAILGGSESCVAMYPGDWAQALVAFDAQVIVSSRNGGERRIQMADLHVPPGDTPDVETTLKPGDIIVRVEVPKSAALKASHYSKARDRESYAFASASAAVGLELDGDTVKDARVAIGGVATVPWRAKKAEDVLKGQPFSEAAALKAGESAFEDATPLEGSAYKIKLGASVVAGALMSAHKLAQKG